MEEYRRTRGIDQEYLNAVGWLARGAEMLGRRDKAALYAAELRKEIPEETPDLIVPLGAAIEVEGKLLLSSDGRGAALRFLQGELSRAKDPSLRSRIRKNMNLLTLEGERAPDLAATEAGSATPFRLSSHFGKPVVLFFWAHWCGDCRAEAAKLARLNEKYGPRGVIFAAPTRLYGTGAERKEVPPAEEAAYIVKTWVEHYPGLKGISIPVDTEAMVRYGASATPTYALIDKAGIVRFYTPTRVSEAELSKRIEALLAE